MLAIEAGDHVGVSFAAGTSFAVTTAAFAHQALDAGGMVMVFPGELTAGSTEQLTTASPRLSEAVRSGRLAFGDSRAVQLATGRFDPDYLHQAYTGATRQALEAGFTGLWVSVDMSWAGPGVAEPRALAAFEAEAFPLFRDRTLTAICQYDTRVFSAASAAWACSAHPASLRAAVLRHRVRQDALVLSGEVDLTNRTAFATIVAALADGDTLDLSGMEFLDAAAASAVAAAAHAHPGLRVLARPVHRRLLELTRVPPAQLEIGY